MLLLCLKRLIPTDKNTIKICNVNIIVSVLKKKKSNEMKSNINGNPLVGTNIIPRRETRPT